MLLTAIEGFYLNVLRVVILVAATLALIAFGLGLTKVGPLITASIGGHSTIGSDQPSLGGWIATQKNSGTSTADTPQTTSAQDALSTDMKSALGHLSSYNTNRMNGAIDMAKAQSVLLSKRETVNADYQADYDHSLDALMAELEQSKGTALETEKLAELVNWHLEQFNAAVTEREAGREAEKSNALIGLGIAGTALISFLMLVFCFLFVKIERNLRLIHVVERPA